RRDYLLRVLWTGLTTIALASGAAGGAQAGQLPPDLGATLVQGYIAPAMLHFQQSARHLQSDLEKWCAAPKADGVKTIQDDFSELVLSWSGIDFLRFGPLVAGNRYERINFWPDPRGITLRQIQGLLGKADQPIPDAAGLAGQSVAL